MTRDHSMPSAIIIPELPSPDVRKAVEWLCQAFGFKERMRIVSPPTDYPYGERQYTAEDIGGHRWIFSQTIADVDPKTWGGILSED